MLRESKLTKQMRIEMEFTQLEMGRLPHSAFLTEWERMLISMDDAGITLPDANTLFRRYLQKLFPSSVPHCLIALGCSHRTQVHRGSRRLGRSARSAPRKSWRAVPTRRLLERWLTPFRSVRCTRVVIASGRTTTWRFAPRKPLTCEEIRRSVWQISRWVAGLARSATRPTIRRTTIGLPLRI